MLLLQALQPQLKRLQLLKSGCSAGAGLSLVEKQIPDVPASWMLPVRDIQPRSSAQLDWEVDVATIIQAGQDSASQQQTNTHWSPSSCLLGGLEWGMQLKYIGGASTQGSTIGLYAHARKLPAGTFCRCTSYLQCVGVAAIDRTVDTPDLFTNASTTWGYPDFFQVGAMSGGFGRAAKGLPITGSITLRLTVKDVGL